MHQFDSPTLRLFVCAQNAAVEVV